MAVAANKVSSDPRDVIRCNTVTDVTRSPALIFTHPQTEEASVDFVSGPLPEMMACFGLLSTTLEDSNRTSNCQD